MLPVAMRLEGRKALVTGGASGIGAAIARRLAAEGAGVVIGDLNEDGARGVAAEVDADAAYLDVADAEAAAAIVRDHGPFAILLEGVFACTHAALPAMQSAGYGRIVNIASEAGRVGSKGSAVYSAAKGGVIAFTKTIARENARFGVTANAIAPGPIETPLLMAATQLGDIGERIIETMKGQTQMRRLGQPEEVAAAVAFLASDDASFVTGETLGVSGGLGMV
jgi:2-hydroxycyclohexanecarboxyl-CoA dehydrogenase